MLRQAAAVDAETINVLRIRVEDARDIAAHANAAREAAQREAAEAAAREAAARNMEMVEHYRAKLLPPPPPLWLGASVYLAILCGWLLIVIAASVALGLSFWPGLAVFVTGWWLLGGLS